MKPEVKQEFEDLVDATVLNAETQVVKKGVKRHQQLEARGEKEGAEKVFRAVMRNADRLKPGPNRYDEEEYIIGNLVKNRARRRRG